MPFFTQYQQIAAEYHSGQSSELYSFSSTGIVHNATDLLAEIDDILEDFPDDTARIVTLRGHVVANAKFTDRNPSKTLVAACSRFANPMRVYSDLWDSLVFFAQNEFGTFHAIQAQAFSDAWEIMLDESNHVIAADACDEILQAYGFWHGEYLLDESTGKNLGSFESSERALEYINAHYPDRELAEGYEYQGNASESGIVNVGHYTTMTTQDDSTILFFESDD